MSRSFVRRARALTELVLSGPGELDATVRRAAAAGEPLPDAEATAYADKVRRHAYRIVDDDVIALRAAGYSDAQIFELTEAAAYGAARVRLNAALAALGEGAQ